MTSPPRDSLRASAAPSIQDRTVLRRAGDPTPWTLLRAHRSFGFDELDLLRPPARFWSDGAAAPPPAALHVDARRAEPLPTPAELLQRGPDLQRVPDLQRPDPPTTPWPALSQRSLDRLLAWFLVLEDPQRRLDAQPVVTLAHQASVVQHILQHPHLRRVLLADEVGLGKTIEAGLLVREILARDPAARVLYLAPARLTRNVRRELDRLGLAFRSWVATTDRDASLTDPCVLASIHRAALDTRLPEFLAAPPWDLIIVDECHHLSDAAPLGGRPGAQYRLVAQLAERLGDRGRLLLMSGTPHQGQPDRFRNLLRLLLAPGEDETALAGRVIYRTKEDVHDWHGRPLFPGRRINPPLVVDLPPEHRAWVEAIHHYFDPDRAPATAAAATTAAPLGNEKAAAIDSTSRSAGPATSTCAAASTLSLPARRASGWRAAQALQWATSSVHAGLGYLVRHAIRAGFTSADLPALRPALEALRPYRLGAPDEPIGALHARLAREIARQRRAADTTRDDTTNDDATDATDATSAADDLDDLEDVIEDPGFQPDPELLATLLLDAVQLLRTDDARWDLLYARLLEPCAPEKVVLFAQPIETVTAVAAYLTRRTGERPALLLGGQTDAQRAREVTTFCDPHGPRFLISSPAGNEGLNLQIARRLVHLDVPWNPMDLEQRIGRVHRFLSLRTILVDTLVTQHSREVDTYAAARDKLRTIASALVPAERFDGLFTRVMSLIPPEELQDLLGRAPLGPLTDADHTRLSELVHRGFEQWRAFHDRYAGAQHAPHDLDPGVATWSDLALFARRALSATDAEGFTTLQFSAHGDEIHGAFEPAPVLAIDDRPYACTDPTGVPVIRDDGTLATPLGLNVPCIARALRERIASSTPLGAAHLTWPSDLAPRPHPTPFGLLVAVRQCVLLDQGAVTERSTTLHGALVFPDGTHRALHFGPDASLHQPGSDARSRQAPSLPGAPLLRVLLRAPVSAHPESDPVLLHAVRYAEAALLDGLRQRTEIEHTADATLAVSPLLAAILH
ncbi:helicase-related protein [Chondromyces crocatus]|uniref:Helicase n=1 Tax=Chondromyces crocatus TaxID=52 RepID=A0A0K1EEL6_CHOCO|nr:helicase-related protein [Chondromyces crocatus]AKT39315.1 uncharacterized protein CMC5_034620 [Chondromyces crocatus]